MRNFVMRALLKVYESCGWWNPWKDIRELKSRLRASERLMARQREDADETTRDLLKEVERLKGRIYNLISKTAEKRTPPAKPKTAARKLPVKKRAKKAE